MSKVNDILNGWGNYLKGGSPATLEKAKERAEICVNCPLATHGLHTAILPDYSVSEIQGMYCGDCGCPLSTAVRSKDYKCPKNFW
jgi:hypothetical protein